IQGSGLTAYTVPRVTALAYAFLQHEDCQVDTTRLRRYLTGYQQVTPLTMGEIWALPIMLRLALLEVLANAAGNLVHLPSLEHPSPLVFITTEALRPEEVVARSIPSLRILDSQSWPEFFEEVSLVHKILCTDPVGIYPQMDFDTRNRYREVIEELALAIDESEVGVAQTALRMAGDVYEPGQATNGQHEHTNGATQNHDAVARETVQVPREGHVGYYLVDDGREALERAVGYRPTGLLWLRRQILRHPTITYLGSAALLTLVVLLLALWYAEATRGGPWMLVLVTLLVLVPASTVALNVLNTLFTRILPPHVLPKLDFSEGVPAEARTMVVVPALLSQQQDVDSLCSQLELHYLRCADRRVVTTQSANQDEILPNPITFALLTDYGDAPEEEMPEDHALIEAATAAITALNEKYVERPFYLFHRHRLWNESEGVWMGWERKRGKLQELNRLLRGADDTSYSVQVGEHATLSTVRYIITLDADTLLPRGEAHR
ncbi:MAG: hypothetical protein KDE53_29830, partial [Caldilineaceae bacterium]|nr:hypothetical protein [Caldilineaceae bacterium]